MGTAVLPLPKGLVKATMGHPDRHCQPIWETPTTAHLPHLSVCPQRRCYLIKHRATPILCKSRPLRSPKKLPTVIRLAVALRSDTHLEPRPSWPQSADTPICSARSISNQTMYHRLPCSDESQVRNYFASTALPSRRGERLEESDRLRIRAQLPRPRPQSSTSIGNKKIGGNGPPTPN